MKIQKKKLESENENLKQSLNKLQNDYEELIKENKKNLENVKEQARLEKENLLKQMKKLEEEMKLKDEAIANTEDVFNSLKMENEKLRLQNHAMNNELKVTLKKELQKAKLENEALQEENERFKELIDSLSQRNKKLESQILINLEMYQNENKKRDEDIEFLLLAFSEMKNREAKEFDYIYNTVNGLSENFEKVHNDLNNK